MDRCSLHCGQFHGVDASAFSTHKAYLEKMFENVSHDPANTSLNICGARNISDTPDDIIAIFNVLASLLDEQGKGHIMLKCEDTSEICYFRHRRWKLEGITLPPDPFEGVYYVE